VKIENGQLTAIGPSSVSIVTRVGNESEADFIPSKYLKSVLVKDYLF